MVGLGESVFPEALTVEVCLFTCVGATCEHVSGKTSENHGVCPCGEKADAWWRVLGPLWVVLQGEGPGQGPEVSVPSRHQTLLCLLTHLLATAQHLPVGWLTFLPLVSVLCVCPESVRKQLVMHASQNTRPCFSLSPVSPLALEPSRRALPCPHVSHQRPTFR